jgi:hypothetical protein
MATAAMSATAFPLSKAVLCMLRFRPLELRVVRRSYESEIKNHRALGILRTYLTVKMTAVLSTGPPLEIEYTVRMCRPAGSGDDGFHVVLRSPAGFLSSSLPT